MTRVTWLLVLASLALFAFALVFGLWVASVVSATALAWVFSLALAISSLAVPGAFWAGWWFGHTEARGFLSGVDKAVDALGQTAVAAIRSVPQGRTTNVSMNQPQNWPALPSVHMVDDRGKMVDLE
jgi:hypothetical protein